MRVADTAELPPMTKPVKIFLVTLGTLVGIAILVPVALYLFVDINDYKPKLEAAASGVSGMQVTLGGKMHIVVSTGVSVRFTDVRVHNRGSNFVDAGNVDVGLELWPLIHGKVSVNALSLQHVNVSVERERDGTFNFRNPGTRPGSLPAIQLADISISDAKFHYLDKRSGTRINIGACDIHVDHAGLVGGSSADLMQALSLKTHVDCAKLQTGNVAATGLSFPLTADAGLVKANPITMNVFDGHGSGSVRGDFSDESPAYVVDFSISGLDVDKFLRTVAVHGNVNGALNLSTRISLSGAASKQLLRSADGTISLHGGDLTVSGINLDDAISKFKTSQRFNLVDAGAFLFAGPFGLAVTKGYDFASITQAANGNTRIRKLVSDWRVQHGMVSARDVAMATAKNRIAVKGTVDLVNKRYEGVAIAVVDARGCALVRQRIHGSFAHPVIEQPSEWSYSSTGGVKALQPPGGRRQSVPSMWAHP